MTPQPESIDDAAPTPPRIIHDEATRAWVYRIALALLVLSVALRVIPVGLEDEISEVISAVLGIGSAGLASANTSTRR